MEIYTENNFVISIHTFASIDGLLLLTDVHESNSHNLIKSTVSMLGWIVLVIVVVGLQSPLLTWFEANVGELNETKTRTHAADVIDTAMGRVFNWRSNKLLALAIRSITTAKLLSIHAEGEMTASIV